MGKLKESLARLKQTMGSEGKTEKSVNDNPERSIKEQASSSSLKSTSSRKSRSDLPEERETLSKKEKRKLAKQQKEMAATEDDSEEEGEEEEIKFDTAALDDSDDSEDEDFTADKIAGDEVGSAEEEDEEEDEEEEEEEEEEDVALSDVELDEDADVVPYQKTTVNNTKALEASYSSISLGTEDLPFYEHFSINTQSIELKDIYDDIERELAFYKQGLSAATEARKKLKKEKVPFSRPIDYFAEMVKSDEHMERLKQKLIDEKTAEKASQEAKRQRELKKFGKKVQHAKLQERQKEKRETLEKIKDLKRKRGNNDMSNEDFDIALEEAASDKPNRPAQKGSKRLAKDAKYGHGGKKRLKNVNDAKSSADISDFNAKSMKSGGKQRPGKSRRHKK